MLRLQFEFRALLFEKQGAILSGQLKYFIGGAEVNWKSSDPTRAPSQVQAVIFCIKNYTEF